MGFDVSPQDTETLGVFLPNEADTKDVATQILQPMALGASDVSTSLPVVQQPVTRPDTDWPPLEQAEGDFEETIQQLMAPSINTSPLAVRQPTTRPDIGEPRSESDGERTWSNWPPEERSLPEVSPVPPMNVMPPHREEQPASEEARGADPASIASPKVSWYRKFRFFRH